MSDEESDYSGSESDSSEDLCEPEVADTAGDSPIEAELAEEKETSPYQKSLWQVEHLPYYKDICVEAERHLASIKTGLAEAVVMRDIRPAFLHWLFELDKYIGLYSRRFTKEDHLYFIHLLWEVMHMEGLEYRMVKCIGNTLVRLLQKRELLSRKDLQLDWRPLYKMYWTVTYGGLEEDGLLLLPEHMKKSVEQVISHCRTYFPLQATAEILAEVRPLLCPWDSAFERGILLLCLFLPTALTAEEHATDGAVLWLDELWFWYGSFPNPPPGTGSLTGLFSRLSFDCPFYVDWSSRPDRLDTLFTYALRACRLQIGQGADALTVGTASVSLSSLCNIVVYAIGGPSTGPDADRVQTHLETFMGALHSYYHPSNLVGQYSENLLRLLLYFSWHMCQRLNRERHRRTIWLPAVPKTRRLTDDNVRRFVRALLPAALSAMFAKTRQELIGGAFGYMKYLGQLAPKIVIPAVLEKLYPALETLTEPHRLQSSLNCLTSLCVPLMRDVGVQAVKQRRKSSAKAGKKRAALQDSPQIGPPNASTASNGEDKLSAEPSPAVGARTHVLPLMQALLPALDPNDMSKAAVAFQVLSMFCALMPVVDCSEAVRVRDDLTDEERDMCGATAQFEEFIDRLLDRMFTLIEHSAAGTGGLSDALSAVPGTRSARDVVASYEENLLKTGVFSVLRSLASNCSSVLHKHIERRVLQFVKENLFASRVAANTVADMAFAVVRTNGGESMGPFLSLAHARLRAHITADVRMEDEADHTLVYYLTLAQSLCRLPGAYLTPHADTLVDLLQLCMPLKSKTGFELTASMIENVLASLCNCTADNQTHRRAKFDSPFEEYLPIRDWARPCDRHSVQMHWYQPGEQEMRLVERILRVTLYGQLQSLASPDKFETKEELQRALYYVRASLEGAARLLPMLEGPLLRLGPSRLDMRPFVYCVSAGDRPLLHLPPELAGDSGTKTVRRHVYEVVHTVCGHLLDTKQDDTRSVELACAIYSSVLFSRGVVRLRYDAQVRSFGMLRRLVSDNIRGASGNIEVLTTEFIALQDQKRLAGRSGYYFTQTHLDIISDLIALATSTYSNARRAAQSVLDTCFACYPFSYAHALDSVLALLRPGVEHEPFKGALYILLNGKRNCLCVRQTWSTLLRVWPALVRAQQSNKPSIIALMDQAQNLIVDGLESFQLELHVSPSATALAQRCWLPPASAHTARPIVQPYDRTQIEQALEHENAVNEKRKSDYYSLVNELLLASADGALHWRQTDLAQALLSLLIRQDMRLPDDVVRLFVRLLVDDAVRTRRMAIVLLGSWMKIARPPAVKRYIDPAAEFCAGDDDRPACVSTERTRWPADVRWGCRPDNRRACMFDADALPKDEAGWDQTVFIDKTFWGLYCWPRRLRVYAGSSSQHGRNRKREELTPAEEALVAAVNDAGWLEKFVALATVDDKDKGSDEGFCPHMVALFKGLFRNFNDMCLDVFKPIIEKLIKSEKEPEQRFAAEFFAGLLQGSRLWTWHRLEAMWSWLVPLLRTAVDSFTSESVESWGSAFATAVESRDPRRFGPLWECLFALVEQQADTSFQCVARFFVLQAALNQCEWRVPQLWRRLHRALAPHMASAYQNVRDRMGSCLSGIVWQDVPGLTVDDRLPIEHTPVSVSEALAALQPRLQPCWDAVEAGCPQEDAGGNSGRSSQRQSYNDLLEAARARTATAGGKKLGVRLRDENGLLAVVNGPVPQVDEPKQAVLVLKSLTSFLQSQWANSYTGLCAPVVGLLPLLFYYENERSDDELMADAHVQLRHGAGRCLLNRDQAQHLLDVLTQLCDKQTQWWKVKVSVCRFVQASVYSNYFVFLPLADRVRSLLHALLADGRLEVRQAASETLAGLVMCRILRFDQQMLATYCDWAGTPVASNKALQAAAAAGGDAEKLARRHAGVLGLAALVQAHPYTVPRQLPGVLMSLCPHSTDPQPISSTVRSVLADFKRTHQDSWHEHKTRFTDDQLLVLTDLLVSPNYYV